MLINIVHELRIAKGTNAKLRILNGEKDNAEWKRFLLATYDSSVNYNVSAPNDNSFTDDVFDSGAFHDHLDRLSSRAITGNDARSWALQGSHRFGELYRLALGGSLKAGISITTINKAYPGLIPVWKVMLGKDVSVKRFPCIASTKYDGVRLTAFVTDSSTTPGFKLVELILRSGKHIQIDSLSALMSTQPEGIYDGELVLGDGLQAGRTGITGLVNKCLKGGSTDMEGYAFCIFDMLDHAEWEVKQTSRGYGDRLHELNHSLIQDDKVKIADMYRMNSLEDLNGYYADRIAAGYEGIMVRYATDPYSWDTNSRRSKMLIKMKATYETTLECYGVTEGKGKYEGMIGALLLRGNVKGKEVLVKTGSGLTDHDREMPSSYFVGHDIEMLYNDIVIAHKAVAHSLFLPRFKRRMGNHDV